MTEFLTCNVSKFFAFANLQLLKFGAVKLICTKCSQLSAISSTSSGKTTGLIAPQKDLSPINSILVPLIINLCKCGQYSAI